MPAQREHAEGPQHPSVALLAMQNNHTQHHGTANGGGGGAASSGIESPFLAVPSQASTPSLAKISASELSYKDTSFAGKEAQRKRVQDVIEERGFIPQDLLATEVEWFYESLGIEESYWKTQSIDTIADHIESLYGAKVQAHAAHKDYLEIDLVKESDDGATYIHTSAPGITDTEGRQYERLIDQKYLDTPTPYRLETYRATGNVSDSIAQQVRCYFVSRASFADDEDYDKDEKQSSAVPDHESVKDLDIRKVSDAVFLDKATKNTLDIYEQVMREALTRMGPVVMAFEVEGSRERRIVIGYKKGGTTSFFSALSNLYHAYGLYSTRKYVEVFKNGIVIISLYLHPLSGPPMEAAIYQITKEASLIYVLPENPFFTPGTGHSVQEAAYAYSGWIFAQHFLDRVGQAYFNLKSMMNEEDPAQAAVLSEIRARFRSETFTRARIQETIEMYPELIRLLYINFAMSHYYSQNAQNTLMPTLSYQRLQTGAVLTDEELLAKIKKTTLNDHDHQILTSFVTFNKAVLKTNFFTPTKVALSYRLSGDFLPEAEYPTPVFGLFLIVGSEFRGFHVRMSDVARGGIRCVMSRNREQYSINVRNLFDENYALAATQALKNKDIPEGGSKGIILPEIGASPRVSFEKYMDSMFDLLLPGKSPGIKEQIVDLYKREEIIFCGPDENTANFMDWAAYHARARGAPWWKSITTGKTAATLGGLPHDAFGMTSLSVRGYTTGIYREVGLKEEDVTKVQVGGPDGDLGSNEILLSKDKTVTIIDGAGTLHDPAGLNREELRRLAKKRVTVAQFDKSKLGPEGYLVLCEEKDVKLPTGETVADGFDFRNSAHFKYKADIFVPCGGRPESVNIRNCAQLWNDEGVPNYKYIVEGANLFITQNARLALEKHGVILFRDSSANKGGVTSSSLEVLSGLALNDEEFLDLMTSPNDEGFSDFYLNYARNIQQIISANATAEFNCIWKEHAKNKKPFTLLSDGLSKALTRLQADMEASNLYDDAVLRKATMTKALPKVLLAEVGLDNILKRLPEVYARSMFASYIASRFIYRYGTDPSNVDFYHFIAALKSESK